MSGVQGVLKALSHRESRCDNQEAPGEPVVAWGGVPVVRGVVEDEHRHHRGLPGGGRHLVSNPVDAFVVLVVYSLDFFPDLVGCCLIEVNVGQHRVKLSEVQLAGFLIGPVVDEVPAGLGDARVSILLPAQDSRPDVVDQFERNPAGSHFTRQGLCGSEFSGTSDRRDVLGLSSS